MSMTETEIIEKAILASDLKNYTGRFRQLGGGELNDTFILELSDKKVILRIAKHADQNSLFREAKALKLLDIPNLVPALEYFDDSLKIDNRYWIVESYIRGTITERLNQRQFNSLGKLLAIVHQSNKETGNLLLWPKFLEACKSFGDENFLINHPDSELQHLIIDIKENLFPRFQNKMSNLNQSLIHGDATPSNVLVNGNSVGLIDWELSSFSDPMADFSTIYYEDIDYNNGKWRLKINQEEKRELFEGYESAGGHIDEDRIRFWINFDKLGAAVFLYWRINNSGREASEEQMEQYRIDYEKIVSSLKQEIST